MGAGTTAERTTVGIHHPGMGGGQCMENHYKETLKGVGVVLEKAR